MTHIDVTGDYRPCPVCKAEARSPFPVDWTLELIKEGRPDGRLARFMTPHRAGCDAPEADPICGAALRMPGHLVIDLRWDDAGWPCDCGQTFTTREGLAAHRIAAVAALGEVKGPIMQGLN